MNKELQEILKTNDIKGLKALLDAGIDIKKRDEDGVSALLLAVEYGQIDMVKYLLDNKYSEANEKDDFGYTALLVAAFNGQFDIVKYLIEKRFSAINEKNNNGQTAFLIAAGNGNVEMVNYLLSLNKNSAKCERDNRGNTALLTAAALGKLDVVQFFIENEYSEINQKNTDGETAFHIAARMGNIEIFKYLVFSDTLEMVFNKENRDGYTPLLVAVSHDQLKIVKFLLLINKNAAREERNSGGSTALIIAASSGLFDIIKFLLENKYSDINEVNAFGKTAFFYAVVRDRIDILDYLLSINGNAARHERYEHGNTALILAANYGYTRMVKYLIEKKYSEINEKNNFGNTALLLAASTDKLEVVEYLLSINKNAARNERNNNGLTALLCAIVTGKIRIVKYLLENQFSESNEKSYDGATAFICALLRDQAEVVSYLLHTLDVNIEDRESIEGHNVLSSAAKFGDLTILILLFEKGAYIDMLLKNGRTARDFIETHTNKVALPLLKASEELIQLAQEESSLNSVEKIVNILGKGLNARQFKTGHTALHLAILNNKNEMVKCLLESGADILMPNRNGDTPLIFLNASSNPYFRGISIYYQLVQIAKMISFIGMQQDLPVSCEIKKTMESQIQELKERKEFKESKETKELSEMALYKPDINLLKIQSEKLLNDFESLLEKLVLEDKAELSLRISDFLVDPDFPSFDPARAYKFLNYLMDEPMLTETCLNEARELILKILISSQVFFFTNRISMEMICKTVTSNEFREESKESFKFRLKCIIKHILYSKNSAYNESLGNYIAQYVFGHENSISEIEWLKGKETKLYLSIIENLKKEAELIQKREIELKEMKFKNEKLRQENEEQKKRMLFLKMRVLERQNKFGSTIHTVFKLI